MMIIGIAGQSGAGKSEVCSILHSRLEGCDIVHQDWYFRPLSELGSFNSWCDPNCLYLERLIADSKALRDGKHVKISTLDLSTFEANGYKEIWPSRYLIIEGMTIFRIPELHDLFDVRIYLDPGLDELEIRKVGRDLAVRQKSVCDVLIQLAWLRSEYRNDAEHFREGSTIVPSNLPKEEVGRQVLEIIRDFQFASGQSRPPH